MSPGSAALLAAWEAASAESPVERAPSLLHSLGRLPAGCQLDDLTVGACDTLLFDLRRALFGDALDAVSTCPHCGDEVSLALSLADLQPHQPDHRPPTATVDQDGFTVECRIPRNRDLAALATRRYADLTDLLDRCVTEARRPDGAPVAPIDLPPSVRQAVLDACAAEDPGAHIPLLINCPCGHDWLDEFDIRAFIWPELTAWVGRTLTDVQRLARAYGWSEADVLAMTPWRRSWYLEAAGW